MVVVTITKVVMFQTSMPRGILSRRWAVEIDNSATDSNNVSQQHSMPSLNCVAGKGEIGLLRDDIGSDKIICRSHCTDCYNMLLLFGESIHVIMNQPVIHNMLLAAFRGASTTTQEYCPPATRPSSRPPREKNKYAYPEVYHDNRAPRQDTNN